MPRFMGKKGGKKRPGEKYKDPRVRGEMFDGVL